MSKNWVSITNQTPNDGRYLVVTRSPYSTSISICSYSNNREQLDEYELAGAGAGFYASDREWGYYCIENVTHWMPLPSLPQE